jgi:ADP-ribose pyrophosphatase
MSHIPFSGPAKRLTDHRFLNLFTTEMHTKDGLQPWIFASRKKDPMSGSFQPDAVVLIVVVAGADEARLVVTREFRGPLGRYELAFPAGLVDEGETPTGAAARELFEETGLTLTKVVLVSPPVSSSAGLTDESACLVYGEATGTISKAHLEEHEDIDTRLMTLAEIRNLIQNPQGDLFSVRLYTTLIGFLTAGKIALPSAALAVDPRNPR